MVLGSPAAVSVGVHLPGYGLTRVFRNAAARIGIYSGVALSLGFTTWLFVANRLPAFENLALERNLVAATALGLLALVPVLRFLRLPGHLLASGLIAWTILTLTYLGLCVHFAALSDRYSAPQVFILGALVYMIFATLSWIGTCLWRARASHISESKPSPGLNPR
jgi:uncharacterized membrane protein YvlD (DUF360 family)